MGNEMKQRLKRVWIAGCALTLVAMGVLGLSGIAGAGEPDVAAGWVSRIVSVQGTVLVRRHGETSWQPVQLNDAFFAGDQIRVESNGRAGIVLSNDAVLRLDQNTTMIFTEIAQQRTFIFRLLDGAANFFSHRPRSLKILTPFVNGVVEGTEFFVQVDATQTRIDLFEGRILAENDHGILELAKGERAVASAGGAPRRYILVQPRESVQWAMYYPPVLALGPGGASAARSQFLALFNEGQTAEAFARLETVDVSKRDATFFVFRAALLLHVGRISEAQSDIQQALALDPEKGDALALKAVIAVVQNRATEAVDTARQAVQRTPRSASAHIALSYALQAQFKLPGALDAAQAAVAQAPGSGLAWARLADLQLSAGALDKGVSAAQKAVALAPRTAHAHSVLGFAHLTRIETEKAREAFNAAIALDSAAPLPRLGLGLADIRDGDLAKGRAEIEIAAGLDPGNSLIRSYLGKAYFEEKRDPQDGEQFEIAKSLDPNDPTPWLYDAIRKQSLNRPVEALQDLQKSIELNDNRAVYRSRLMLDEDQAARGVSLARTYDNLRFNQLAVNESTKSLSVDPSNYSAHNFLSDSYSRRPRHESARVSELLQSQLLQPINRNPVQPESAETDLTIPIGANSSDASFNEFSPLFERDGIQLTATGVAGNNDTLADQAVVSGLFRRFSYSLGQFHYETDGFRENNQLRHDLYNVFAQAAVTSDLDLQVEYRQRKSEEGDLRLYFDPEDYSRIFNRSIDQDLPRVGLRFSPSANSDLIVSYMYGDREEETSTRGQPSRFGQTIQTTCLENDGYDLQTQYLHRSTHFSVITGVGIYEIDGNRQTDINLDDPSHRLLLTGNENLTSSWHEAHLYSDISFPDNLTWTIGASYIDFEDGQDGLTELTELNPKFGLQWRLADAIRLRLAAMKTVKRSLIFNQSLEPSQVSGFSQFFDDFNGTISKRYGIGVDIDLTQNLYTGIELSRRDLKVPRTFRTFAFTNPPATEITPTLLFEDQQEDLYRAYLYWTPIANWSVSGELQWERFQRDPAKLGNQVAESSLPDEVETLSVPLMIRWFTTVGLFANAGVTYVGQKVDLPAGSSFGEDEEDFIVVDASVGYRFHGRWGVISFDVKNLFDEEFLYQDVNIQTADPSQPVFTPERTFLARFTFNF
jgi:tetratricopeptide (TPR) repeat protein